MFLLLVSLPVLFTVARFVRNGFHWFQVLAALSKTVNWWLGGDIQDTLSCRVAQETFAGTSPRWAWRGLHLFLDFAALPFEKNHCVASMIDVNDKASN